MLSLLEKKFVQEYVKDTSNPRGALIRAGFRHRGAKAEARAERLLQKKEVAERIQLEIEEAKFRNSITQDYFVSRLKDIIDIKPCNTADKISALGLLAKITGFMKDKPSDNRQLVIVTQKGIDDMLTDNF